VWKLVSVGNPTIKKKWLEFISQQKKNYAFAIFNQFIVSLSAPCFNHCALTHCVPTVQLNSIFSAKTDPRENPGKKPGNSVIFSEIESKQTSAAPPFPLHAREAKPAERRARSQSFLNTTFSFYQAYQVHHQNVKCIIILNYLKTEAIHFRYIIIL
jgi:hypothetical protein